MDDPVAELVELFARLPGVGERTASRLAYFVLGADAQYAEALGASLGSIHDRVKRCETCGNFTAASPCRICLDPARNDRLLCVVARVPDLIALERSGTFRGRYHVLHALLSPLDGVGPDAIDAPAICARVQATGIEEVVVATPLSVEGEATALYLKEVLAGTAAKVSRIASGLPHGGELEYADQITLGRAFERRTDL